MIRVLVADDHAVVRQGICGIINTTDDLRLIGEASNGWHVLDMIVSTDADLLLTDMSMPGPSGGDLVEQVKRIKPDLPILVLSVFSEAQIAESALQRGASGYLTKNSDPGMIIAAIRQCASGAGYIQPELAARIMMSRKSIATEVPHATLSKRERQIMLLIASGMSINVIAGKLYVSPKTVSTHKFRIMQKLQLQSVAELVRYAIRHRLIEQ